MPSQSARRAPSTATYLHTSDAAAVFGVSPKTITRWAREGKVPHRKTLGGHRRYDPTVIATLAASLVEEVAA
jgi:excisionase family DNA binding protein